MISQARFNALHSGLTSVARKVYDVVPLAEQWTTKQIVMEMNRRGMSMDTKIIQGCLESLVHSGLVREPARGEFTREAVKALISKPVINKEYPEMAEVISNITTTLTKVPAVVEPSPMERIGALAQRVNQISAMLQSLAEDINDAAVEIQAQMESNEKDVKRLKQLQALLKGDE